MNNNHIDDLKTDYGPKPFVANIKQFTLKNPFYRRTLWTGNHFQVTLMSIPINGDIGLEVHPNLDQFICVESGKGIVTMGKSKNNMSVKREINQNYAFIIPANTWHNLINTGNTPIKLYSIYAPTQHPKGTVHKTKAEAE